MILSRFKRAVGPPWVRLALLGLVGLLAVTQSNASAKSWPIVSITPPCSRTPVTPPPTKNVFINVGPGYIGTLHGKTYEIFAITLTKRSNSDVYVNVSTKAGTATAGDDYKKENYQIKFVPGEPVYYFYVPLIKEKGPEPSEFFYLDIWNPVNAQTGLNNEAILPPINSWSYGY